MKTIKLITAFIFMLSGVCNSFSQTGDYFTLKAVMHNNTARSVVKPYKAEALSTGGFVEVEVEYYNNCRERYRFEFKFDQDLSSMVAKNKYGFTYNVRLLSKQCNHNRNASIRPMTPLGGTSSLDGSSGFSDLVNAFGVESSSKTYAKDLGKPNIYTKGEKRGYFIPVTHKLNAYSWIAFYMEAPSNLKGKSFFYEVLYIYKIANEEPVEVFSCPPPDCSGFPGTVPVWNFETMQGECWCPEGTRWDKNLNRCVSIK